MNKVMILGSGTSTGIPQIGCDCAVCQSNNPKNKRLRCSLLIETKSGKKVLVDTTPDFRTQALRSNISHIDSVLITHDHADHTHGIDDLRPLSFGPPVRSIPIYTHEQCAEELTRKFPYIFRHNFFNQKKPELGGGIPKLSLNNIATDGQAVDIDGDNFHFFLLPHGHSNSMAIIHEGLAILIDCHTVTDEVKSFLSNREIELLIIDCVNNSTHNTHLTVDTSFEIIREISPRRAGLIHMGHSLEHESLVKKCQESFNFEVFPTFDTQLLSF